MTRFLEGITVKQELIQSEQDKTCWICTKIIHAGDWVLWSPGFKSVQHPDCKPRRVGYGKRKS